MIPFSALFDAQTTALIALSQYPYIISFLAKSRTLEAEQAHAVNLPNYRANFTLVNQSYQVFPSWSWDMETRRFSPTPMHLITPELKQRSEMAMRKVVALAEIAYELSVARYPVWRGVLMQEMVYAAKRAQAQHYKDHPGVDVMHYPYVMQYADFAGLTPHEAANEILFKARLDDDLLLNTEMTRLKYFGLVEVASAAKELDSILKQFRRDIYKRVS